MSEKAVEKPQSKVRDVVVAIGAVLSAVVVSIIFVDNRVAAQTDAGVKVMEERHEALKGRVEVLEQRFNRFEARNDQQMNLALDALRVPQSARPSPLDGGVP